MTADSAPHWLDLGPADFDESATPVQDTLFITPAPVVRPGERARAGAQLAGQTDILAELSS